MNERIQRNGLVKTVHVGSAVTTDVPGYDVYDESMRFVIASTWGIDDALAALERDIRWQKSMCATGSCED